MTSWSGSRAEVTDHYMVSIYIATLPETKQFLMVDPKPEKDVWRLLCVGQVESVGILEQLNLLQRVIQISAECACDLLPSCL